MNSVRIFFPETQKHKWQNASTWRAAYEGGHLVVMVASMRGQHGPSSIDS
jgi:hypothetical protein